MAFIFYELASFQQQQAFEFESDHPDSDLLKVTILDENDASRGVATFTITKIQEHERSLGCLHLSADRGV